MSSINIDLKRQNRISRMPKCKVPTLKKPQQALQQSRRPDRTSSSLTSQEMSQGLSCEKKPSVALELLNALEHKSLCNVAAFIIRIGFGGYY